MSNVRFIDAYSIGLMVRAWAAANRSKASTVSGASCSAG
jgi:hypothetical protein